ncbi:hypothetical protein JCM16358_08360 [Halanaerocella petrolearia]
MRKDLKKEFENTKMIFVNIAWMKYYRGQNERDQIPKNSGGGKSKYHVEETMFYDIDGYLYGFAYPGSYNNKWKKLNLKGHFSDCVQNDGSSDYVENTLVVWVAQKDKRNNSPHVIIGWWNNATIYREYEKIEKPYIKKWFNIKAKLEDSFLLEENDRNYKIGRRKTDGVGFGQSNIWYADRDFEQQFKFKVYKYIDDCENSKNNLVAQFK